MKNTLFNLKSSMKPILSRPITRSLSSKTVTPPSSLSKLEFSPPKPKIPKSFNLSSYSHLEKFTSLKQSIDIYSTDQVSFNDIINELALLSTTIIHELIHVSNSPTNNFLQLFQDNCHVLNLIVSTKFDVTFKLTQLATVTHSISSSFDSLLSKLLSEHSTATNIKRSSFKSLHNDYFYPFNKTTTISMNDMFQFVTQYKTIIEDFPLKQHRPLIEMFSEIISYYLINKVFVLHPEQINNTVNKEPPFKFIKDNRRVYYVDINIDNLIDLITFHKEAPKSYILIFLRSVTNLTYKLKEEKIKEFTKRLLEETFNNLSLVSNILKHLLSIHSISKFKEELEILTVLTFKGATNILSSQFSENFISILNTIIKQLPNSILNLEFNSSFKTVISQCVTFLNSTYNKPSVIDLNILCLNINIIEDEELLLNNNILNLLQIDKIIKIKIKLLTQQKNKRLNLDLYYKIINKLTNIYYNKKSNKRKLILTILLNVNFIIQFYYNNIFVVLDFINSIYQFETNLVQNIIKDKLCEVKLSDNTILYIFLCLKNIHFKQFKTLQITENDNLNVKFSKLYLTNQHTNKLYDPVIMTTYSLLKRINDANNKTIDIYYITEVKRMFNKIINVVNYNKHIETVSYLNKECLNTTKDVLINNKLNRNILVVYETSKLMKRWAVFYINTNNNDFLDRLRKNIINNYPVTELILFVYKKLHLLTLKNDIIQILLSWLLNPDKMSISLNDNKCTKSILYNFLLLIKYMNTVQKDEKLYSLLIANIKTVLNTLNKGISILTTLAIIKAIHTDKELGLLFKQLIKELYKLLSSKYLYLNFCFILPSLLTFIKKAANEYIPYTDIGNIKYIIKSLIYLYESSILIPRSESRKVTELIFFKSDFELRIIVQLYITQLLKVQKSNYELVLNNVIYAPFSDTFGKQSFTFNTLKDNFREFLNVYYKVDLTTHSKEVYSYKLVFNILENIIDKTLDCILGDHYDDIEKYILSVIITFYEIMKFKSIQNKNAQIKTRNNLTNKFDATEFDRELENSVLRPFMAVGDMLCNLEIQNPNNKILVDYFIAFFGCVYKNHKHKNILYKINKLINVYLDRRINESVNKKELEMIYRFKNIIIDIVII